MPNYYFHIESDGSLQKATEKKLPSQLGMMYRLDDCVVSTFLNNKSEKILKITTFNDKELELEFLNAIIAEINKSRYIPSDVLDLLKDTQLSVNENTMHSKMPSQAIAPTETSNASTKYCSIL